MSIIQQSQAGQGAPVTSAAPQAPQAANPVPIKPSSEDFKKAYEKYVDKATILIHAPETRQAVLSMLDGPDPVQKVASAVVMVMQRIDNAARAQGIEIQDSVRVLGAYEINKLVIEFGEAAKKFDLDDDLAMLSLSTATQDYVKSETAAGRINPKQVKVRLEMDLRKMPPKFRKQAMDTQKKLPEIARRYDHGRGLARFSQDSKRKM